MASQSSSNNSFRQALESNNILRVGHYRLYKWDLLETLTCADDVLHFARENVKSAKGKELKELFDNGNDGVALAREAVWKIVNDDATSLEELLLFAVKKRASLAEEIFAEMARDSLVFYLKFFPSKNPQMMESIVKTLEPLPICDQLQDYEYQPIITEVRRIMANRLRRGRYDLASRFMMRSLPRVRKREDEASDWYFDFLCACLQDPYNRTIPKYVDPNCSTSLEVYEMRRKQAQPSQEFGIDGGIQVPATVDDDQTVFPCRKQQDYKQFHPMTDAQIQNLLDPEPIELRPYQLELVESACKGVNTIVCAPTGSGKTVVAAYIISNHLQKQAQANEPSRVAMLVPTVPLVEQQTKLLNRYLRKTYWLDGMSGCEPVPDCGRASAVLLTHVALFTPQLFINLLKNVRKDDRLYLSDFTLFVFDECHHCDGSHPYNVLMRMVHDYEGAKPQIVGLTASLPVRTARVDAALDQMASLCARMSAFSISSVRKRADNLRQFVTPPVDEVEKVSRQSQDPVNKKLQDCMLNIEMEVRRLLEVAEKQGGIQLRSDERSFPFVRNATRYENFVGSLKFRLNELPPGALKLKLLKLMDHLVYYYRALTMNDLLPSFYALHYLREKYRTDFAISTRSEIGQLMAELHRWFSDLNEEVREAVANDNDGESRNIVRRLHKLLRDQYAANSSSKTIIFVTTRLLAEMLEEHLNRVKVVPGGRRPVGHITSSNQSLSAGGQSAEAQRATIQSFLSGTLKVLVATSVAEEGLDISACNLIIKYNNTGSELSLIQRRGRARAKNSRSILLAIDGTIEDRELDNLQKEQVMKLCLEHLQTIPESQMEKMVKAKILEEKLLREQTASQVKQRQQLLAGKCCNLNCRLCGALISKSRFMRVACDSQYVCCDREIWQRVAAEVHCNDRAFSIATTVGRVMCKGRDGVGCHALLGTVIKLYGTFLPTIKASAITPDVAGNETRKKQLGTWDALTRDVFFVEPISVRDLKIMLDSSILHSKKRHDEFEAEATLVARRSLKDATKERKLRACLPDD